MTSRTRYIMRSTRFRVFLSVLGIVVVAALVLASTHNSPANTSGTTETTAAGTLQVPQLVGLPETAAETLLQSDGLKVSVTSVASKAAVAGTVLSQKPSAGTNVRPGSTVTLTAAAQTALPVIPNVVGQTETQAKTTLNSAGFPVKSVLKEHSSVTSGDVVGTNPGAGTPVPANSSVQLIISLGPTKVRTTTPPRRTVVKPPPTTRPTSPKTPPTSPPTTQPTTPPTTVPPTTVPVTTTS